MRFNSIFLTNAGIALLNRAVSGTTIIWGECACTGDTLTTSSIAIENRVCSGNTVAAFNDSEQIASLSCSMDNTADDLLEGNAVSFGIFAKIQGDDNEVLAICATSSQPMSIPTYASDDGTTKVNVLVNLSVDISDGVVQVLEITEHNVYALAMDLQTEINARYAFDTRCVTTHAAGDPNRGDRQYIRGKKTFYDDCYFGAIWLDDIVADNRIQCNGSIQAEYYIQSNGDVRGKNFIGISADSSIGTQESPMYKAFIKELEATKVVVHTIYGHENEDMYEGELCLNIQASNVFIEGNDGNILILDSSGLYLAWNYSIQLSGSGKFKGDLEGRIPFPESSSEVVPIGSIVLLRIKYTEILAQYFEHGMLRESGLADYELAVGSFGETGINANNVVRLASGQKFRTLSGSVFANSQVSHALAVRVE